MIRALTLALVLALAGAAAFAQSPNKAAILNSKHDFRAVSTAPVRSVSGQDPCVFCHTPHNANPAELLWNHNLSSTPFSSYSSSTLESTVGSPQAKDVSKLCLSCHDGTIALGATVNDGTIPFVQGSAYTLPAGSSSNVAASAGFSDDHPFAFPMAAGRELQLPPPSSGARLDSASRVQCTTCHEPHRQNIDPVTQKFLVGSNQASALCLSCHIKTGWSASSHRQPLNPLDDQRYTAAQGAHTGYTGVANNGCESCHRPHTSQVAQRLIKFPEENTCYACHDGSVAAYNIKSEIIGKTYAHPVIATHNVHDAAESPAYARSPLPETSAAAPRHSQCVDCHEPHAAYAAAAQPPLVSGALAGVTGQSSANAFLPQSVNEYEICFKCHADSVNKPQFNDVGAAGVGYGRNPQRQFNLGNPNRFNTRMEFGISASYHPVTRPRNLSTGAVGDVPSLRAQPITPGGAPLGARTLSAAGYIYCTDCHNNDTSRNLGQLSGPAGAHGSNYPHLLERAAQLEPPPATPGANSAGVNYSPANYSLCDKCHDLAGSILQNRSFTEHNKHISGENAACSTCHDPHASSAPMLINFDRSIVAPSSSGRLEYRRTGFRQGQCYLTCHGKNHDPYSYAP